MEQGDLIVLKRDLLARKNGVWHQSPVQDAFDETLGVGMIVENHFLVMLL